MYVLVCDLDGDGDLDFASIDAKGRYNTKTIVYYENVGDASNPNFIQHREKELNPFYEILQHMKMKFSQYYDAQLVDIDGDGKFCSLTFLVNNKINWKKITHVSISLLLVVQKTFYLFSLHEMYYM